MTQKKSVKIIVFDIEKTIILNNSMFVFVTIDVFSRINLRKILNTKIFHIVL